ncbi:hypothetical protein CCC_01743 [Paramagnetospirillum magnetotacticum MS-1]|uniref:Uncharacterized protein n=1 Tax=Paramagnetospirillum magnetotacticum MS-1 TaxID=272627 RepID=A0A0C2Z063_PARME|nr:hypothetical protein [Paramagnetospirillum magnetotacticum]KIM00749.1 hypothetical protein CCC_01743 [Paramagnetospirillum magnetotacticum MS-1]
MPKFLVSIARNVAKRDVLEVSAESADEARWIAASSCDAWMDAELGEITVMPAPIAADHKMSALKSAA